MCDGMIGVGGRGLLLKVSPICDGTLGRMI